MVNDIDTGKIRATWKPMGADQYNQGMKMGEAQGKQAHHMNASLVELTRAASLSLTQSLRVSVGAPTSARALLSAS